MKNQKDQGLKGILLELKPKIRNFGGIVTKENGSMGLKIKILNLQFQIMFLVIQLGHSEDI